MKKIFIATGIIILIAVASRGYWEYQQVNVQPEHSAIATKLSFGIPVEVLVLLDDSAEQAEIDREEVGLPDISKRTAEVYQSSMERRKQKLHLLKQHFKSDIGMSDIEFLTEYAVLPTLHIKIKSIEALKRIENHPKVRSIEENKSYSLNFNTPSAHPLGWSVQSPAVR